MAVVVSCQASDSCQAYPDKSAPGQEQADLKQAARLFHDHCTECHGTDGKGGPARNMFSEIPDFTQAQWQKGRSDSQLDVSIRDGKGKNMPVWGAKLSPPQIRALAAFVRTFDKKASTQKESDSGSAEKVSERISQLHEQFQQLKREAADLKEQGLDASPALQAGTSSDDNDQASETDQPSKTQSRNVPGAAPAARNLFRKHCQKCHGAEGTGRPARDSLTEIPDFTTRSWQQEHSDERIKTSILEGKGDNMPSFRDEIGEEQLPGIVAHVRKFAVGPKEPSSKALPPVDPDGDLGSDRPPTELVANEENEERQSDAGFFGKLTPWLGKFHPVMVHFPIALLFAAGVAELLLMFTHRPLFKDASRYCVWFGAIAAVPTATLGWFLAGPHLSDANWILTTHRWLGTSTVVCAGFVLLLSELARGADRLARIGFRLAISFTLMLILVTGFFGGALIHPLRYYVWPP